MWSIFQYFRASSYLCGLPLPVVQLKKVLLASLNLRRKSVHLIYKNKKALLEEFSIQLINQLWSVWYTNIHWYLMTTTHACESSDYNKITRTKTRRLSTVIPQNLYVRRPAKCRVWKLEGSLKKAATINFFSLTSSRDIRYYVWKKMEDRLGHFYNFFCDVFYSLINVLLLCQFFWNKHNKDHWQVNDIIIERGYKHLFSHFYFWYLSLIT